MFWCLLRNGSSHRETRHHCETIEMIVAWFLGQHCTSTLATNQLAETLWLIETLQVVVGLFSRERILNQRVEGKMIFRIPLR